MSDFWDDVDKDGPEKHDDLKSYIEERRRKAAQYVRTAKRAQEKIDQLKEIEDARKRALTKKG